MKRVIFSLKEKRIVSKNANIFCLRPLEICKVVNKKIYREYVLQPSDK